MTPLPPPPPSARPPTPQPRRKTSLRTVPKQVQAQFASRVQELSHEPRKVLPEVVGEVPRPLARLQARLDKIAGGRPGLLMRRDKGIAGAVLRTIAMQGRPVPTRMLDIKVGGQRRFFIPRGHVERLAMAGVQNHDHPPSLLLAYRSMAKAHALHFFASPRLWCTGSAPAPPEAWLEALQERANVTFTTTDDGWSCGHEVARVVLGFRGGPSVEICGPCGQQAGNMHRIMATRYAGPRERQPFEVRIRAPDGSLHDPPREPVAEYRGGVKGESELIRTTLAGWVPQGRVWMVGSRIHTTMDAWLDAMEAHPWEREALRAMAADGYKGQGDSVAAVLQDLQGELESGVRAILGRDAAAFLRAHHGQGVRDIVRGAHEERERRQRMAAIPTVRTGPIGAFVDKVARARLAGGRHEALDVLRRSLGEVPDLHAAALVVALGGDVTLESRIPAQDREAATGLADLAREVLASERDAYVAALERYLQEAGTGEHVRR